MFRRLLAAMVAALFALAWAAPSPGSQAKPPVKKARKVWTNEDLEALRPGGVTVLEPSRVVSTAPAAVEEAAARKEEEKAEGEKKEGPSRLEKIRKRLDPLRAELGAVELQLQSLRDKRTTGNTTGQGIDITKAPGGLTTDNQVTQLENRRSILLRQISDIEDEARRLSISPGALR